MPYAYCSLLIDVEQTFVPDVVVECFGEPGVGDVNDVVSTVSIPPSNNKVSQ